MSDSPGSPQNRFMIAAVGPSSPVHIEMRWSSTHHQMNQPMRFGPSPTTRPELRIALPDQRSRLNRMRCHALPAMFSIVHTMASGTYSIVVPSGLLSKANHVLLSSPDRNGIVPHSQSSRLSDST